MPGSRQLGSIRSRHRTSRILAGLAVLSVLASKIQTNMVTLGLRLARALRLYENVRNRGFMIASDAELLVSTLPTVTRQSDQWMDLNSPPLTDPSRFEIHQFATAGRASASASPSARDAGQARRVSPDLARHGSGCPVLGSLVPSGIHRIPHRRRTGCVLSVLASKIQTWSHMASASRARRDCSETLSI